MRHADLRTLSPPLQLPPPGIRDGGTAALHPQPALVSGRSGGSKLLPADQDFFTRSKLQRISKQPQAAQHLPGIGGQRPVVLPVLIARQRVQQGVSRQLLRRHRRHPDMAPPAAGAGAPGSPRVHAFPPHRGHRDRRGRPRTLVFRS